MEYFSTCIKKGSFAFMDYILMFIAAIAGITVLFKIITAPIKLIFKLLLNGVTGFFILLIVNIIAGFFDFAIALSLLNILIAGFFGIPGAILLIVLAII